MSKKKSDFEKAFETACTDLKGELFVNLYMACLGNATAENLRALKIEHAKDILSQAAANEV